MATHLAISSTCEAIVRLLRSSYDPADFGGAALSFQVYVAEDFAQPMTEGVSILLYRVYHSGAHRTPRGRRLPDGREQRSKLPVELHFLLTAWAKKASLQHEIAGWAMRVLEDHPMLPASLLNAYRAGVFAPDETVEISLAELSVDDMFHIWEVMINHVYQLSVPYVARPVILESALTTTSAPAVQERIAAFHELS